MYKIFPWCHCDTDQRGKKKAECREEASKKVEGLYKPSIWSKLWAFACSYVCL